jgi:hypothetical protein
MKVLLKEANLITGYNIPVECLQLKSYINLCDKGTDYFQIIIRLQTLISISILIASDELDLKDNYLVIYLPGLTSCTQGSF